MEKANSKKILVVDDEEEILKHLVRVLERYNYEVISATKGKEALELATDQKPDLIILDIVLPDIDGGQVAFALSENPSTANIPVVFLTGMIKKDEEHTVKTTGNRFVIAKPVVIEELLEKIRQIFPG